MERQINKDMVTKFLDGFCKTSFCNYGKPFRFNLGDISISMYMNGFYTDCRNVEGILTDCMALSRNSRGDNKIDVFIDVELYNYSSDILELDEEDDVHFLLNYRDLLIEELVNLLTDIHVCSDCNKLVGSECLDCLSSKFFIQPPSSERCSICLNELGNDYHTTLCKHSFHRQCFNTLRQQQNQRGVRCPMCRGDLH
jgi:hypothetical protein